MYNEKLGKDIWMLSNELQEVFKEYQWVGNVRELQNLIESAMNMVTDEHVISKEHLPAHFEGLVVKKGMDVKETAYYDADEGLAQFVDRIEREIIEKTLLKFNFNITQASKELKISRQNLQYKMKKYNLNI